MTLGGVRAAVKIYDQQWRSTLQGAKSVRCEPTYPARYGKLFKLDGTLQFSGTEGFTFQQRLTETAADTVDYSFTLKSPEGIPCRSVALSLRLPARDFEGKKLLIDGKPVAIASVSRPFRNVERVELMNGDRRIIFTGKLTVGIQDHRGNSMQEFSLRLLFTPNGGTIREAKLSTKITVETPTAVPLEFGKTATGGKALDTALKEYGLDRKPRVIGGIPFRPGNGLLKLGAGASVPLTLPEADCRELYLLHSASQGARPTVILSAGKGAEERRIELLPGREFNTSIPSPRLPNGAHVAANDRTGRGMFFSRLPLGDDAGSAIRLENAGSGEWVVAGVTAAEISVAPDSVNSIFYIDAGEEWAPMERVKPVARGSVLDFSGFVDAPAGKYGRIVVDKAGHFVTERNPGKRIRFFGPNLCFSAQYLDRETAEKLADELVMLGYNAVRIHHYDNELADPKGNDSTVFDPEKIDKLDYLFSCFKKRGLYVTLDLYCSRRFRNGEMMDAPLRTGYAIKQLAPVYAPARENWKKFARNLLTHRNPYTGMTWREDPTLFAVSLTNENITVGNWNKQVPELYLDAYRNYLEKRNLATEENLASRGELFYRFLVDLNVDMIEDFSRFLREEIGYRGLITEINFRKQTILSEIRDHLDFVDNHNYWDHPNSLPGRAWTFPRLHNQKSSIKAASWSPRTLMPSRIFGKPFTVSEINFVFPNRYRAESGPLLGAYASLQDWDGLFRFTWAHEEKGVRHMNPINRFNLVDDSLSQVAERITNLMFVRGDVKPAEILCSYQVPRNSFERKLITGFPPAFKNLGLITAVGSQPEDRRSGTPSLLPILPADATRPDRLKDRKIAALWEQANRRRLAVSATGELRLDAEKNTFTVTSPRTESVTLSSGDLAAGQLRVRQADGFQTIAAISLDGKALSESSSVLFFQLTDVASSGLKFSNRSKRLVLYRGNLPLLVRKGTATVEFVSDRPCTVTALHCDGTPCGSVRGSFQDGIYRFQADTHQFPGGVMAYHLTR